MLWFIPLVINDCNRKASHYQKQCFCCTHPRIPQHDADSIEDQQEVRLLDNTSSCLENSNQVRVEEKVCTLQKLFNIIFFRIRWIQQAIKASKLRHIVTQEHSMTKLYTVSNNKYSKKRNRPHEPRCKFSMRRF